jgi:uncharacterized cofD-like protein
MQDKKIVAIGGGTGLFTLLSGLKEYTKNITAIVTTADDGGSSGILRDELGFLPVGDIRRCIIALSESRELMYELFNYRFERGSLAGHSVGNLLIAAMLSINNGDFLKTLKQFSSILAIRGRVLPATLQNVTLYARLEDGSIVKGEAAIGGYHKYSHEIDVEKLTERAKISTVFINPRAKALPEALVAIKEADMIILGPGSLYTSIISNFLVDGVAKAIKESKAKKIFVCNVMTQIGETEDYSAFQHLSAIEEYLGKGIVNIMLLNTGTAKKETLERYKTEYKELVIPDVKNIPKNIKVIKKNLIKGNILVRHDPKKLAKAIMAIINK